MGVIALHSVLTTLHGIAASHVGGIRPTGLGSTLLYEAPLPPDVTHRLTLNLFPIESIELSFAIEEEPAPPT